VEAQTSFSAALVKPQQLEKIPPCREACLTGGDIRGWVAVLAQQRKLGLSRREAYSRAWRLLVETNPFPATLGRVCPHPCQTQCNRANADGAVSVNAMERFLGDWALGEGLELLRQPQGGNAESIGVIGAGPAGLSFAYQMARRGYRVTIYEKQEKPGGMLRYGIPRYRLPESVLEAEVARILALGIELKPGAAVGRNIELERVKTWHDVLFLGIGAGAGRKLAIPGEEGQGAWTGIEYLARVTRREPLGLGENVVVVGGGNTAVDAARAARRAGARVTMLYRRSRVEMPANAHEVKDALAEGVVISYLAAPAQIKREGGRVRAVVVQRMALGESDASGRRRPVPVPGSEYELPADCVIAAVSQGADWEGLGGLNGGGPEAHAAADGRLGEAVWAGGDVLGPGLAGIAIAQGRRAAEALHAQLRGKVSQTSAPHPLVAAKAIKSDYYAAITPIASRQRPVEERLAQSELEVNEAIGEEEFLQEASRCYSCGSCFGCEHCFMYCNAGGFARLPGAKPGGYFALSLESCESCGKCIEVCPCAFLSPQ
jgi:NADPH-dependent glutamate synthase beta subunit-like oxidoreductase/Pyruvate/2-oxoacid:ferredoxin oxidoreductase delta subunit